MYHVFEVNVVVKNEQFENNSSFLAKLVAAVSL